MTLTRRRLRAAIAAMAALLALTGGAAAHTPHDDAFTVAYDRAQATAMLALVRSSIYRSADGGESWRRVVRGVDNARMLVDLALAADGRTAYAVSLGDGVLVSRDSGASWGRANAGLATTDLEQVAIAPSAPATAAVLGRDGSLHLTRDAGARWTRLDPPATAAPGAFAFDPREAGTLYVAAGAAVHVTRDSGASWVVAAQLDGEERVTALTAAAWPDGGVRLLLGGAAGTVRVHAPGAGAPAATARPAAAPVTDLAAAPDAGGAAFVAATYWDAGVRCSRDGGAAWADCTGAISVDSQHRDLGRPAFSDVALAPDFAGSGGMALATYQGLFQSADRGDSWTGRTTLSPHTVIGMDVAAGANGATVLAAGTMLWGLRVSPDGGDSWRAANAGITEPYVRDEGLIRVFRPLMSPDHARDGTMFTSTWYDIYRSRDRGESWQRISPEGLPWWEEEGSHAVTLALSPAFERDGLVLAGTHRGRLLRSTDGGDSFRQVTQLEGYIGDVAFSPDFARDRTVLVSDSRSLAISRDAGESWRRVPLQPAARPGPAVPGAMAGTPATEGWPFFEQFELFKARSMVLALSPAFGTDGIAFAGTSRGFFRADGELDDWRRIAMPGPADGRPVEAVAVSPDFRADGTVLAVVRGHGLMRSEDGGQSFAPAAPALLADQVQFSHPDGLAPRFPTLLFSPHYAEDRTVHGFAGESLWRSTDGGASWAAITVPDPTLAARARAAWLEHWKGRPRREKLAILLAGLAVAGAATAVAGRRYFRPRRG